MGLYRICGYRRAAVAIHLCPIYERRIPYRPHFSRGLVLDLGDRRGGIYRNGIANLVGQPPTSRARWHIARCANLMTPD